MDSSSFINLSNTSQIAGALILIAAFLGLIAYRLMGK
jgi:hypothetical protein